MVLLRRFDPEEALRLIERHRVTVWTGVPTMYKRIAGLPPQVVAKYDVSSIRMLGVGAAPVPNQYSGRYNRYWKSNRLTLLTTALAMYGKM